MRVNEIPFAVLRMNYRIARFPLQLIDDRMVSRLDEEAPGRLLYERSLGALDASIGGMLRDSEVQERGIALRERSDALARAAQLDAVAEQELKRADDNLQSVHKDAVADVQEAKDAEQRRIGAARDSAQQRKNSAVQRAQKRTAAEARKADELAARRKESAEAARREEQAKIRATEQKATAAAKAKLDDAQAGRNGAAQKRDRAEKLDELADSEKRNR